MGQYAGRGSTRFQENGGLDRSTSSRYRTVYPQKLGLVKSTFFSIYTPVRVRFLRLVVLPFTIYRDFTVTIRACRQTK